MYQPFPLQSFATGCLVQNKCTAYRIFVQEDVVKVLWATAAQDFGELSRVAGAFLPRRFLSMSKEKLVGFPP